MGIIVKISINNNAGPKKIICLKNAFEASFDLISATLYNDINPIHKIAKMIAIKPKGDVFTDFNKLEIIDYWLILYFYY